MKRSIKSAARILLPLAVLIMALLASTDASAQESASQTESWQFGVSIYGWFPDLTGETAFTPPGGSNEFEIKIEDILDNLEFTLMGMFEVHKGRWGFLTDAIYMDVGASENGTRDATIGRREIPVGAAADIDLDMKSLIWTLAGTYRVLDQSGLTLDVLAGARYLDIEQEVDWVVTGNVGPIPAPDRTGSAKASLTNWDALIGVRGRYAFGTEKAWFVPYHLDVGAGDSDLTYQGIAGLGYAFRWCEVAAVWRYLYYDLSDKAISDVGFSGLAAGGAFR